MGALEALAKIAGYLPTVERPRMRPSLYERLGWTALALIAYIVMANTFLYGIPTQGIQASPQILLLQVIFASNRGTLMELGIGPIVTAGLIMQILAGAKMIEIDLSDPEDRKKFTAAQKSLAVILAAFEASLYAVSCRYWYVVGGNPITGCTASAATRAVVALQIFLGAYIAILLDEMIQKGWGIGSGVSLFILAGVAQTIFWDVFSPLYVQGTVIGLVPYMVQVNFNPALFVIRPGGRDLVGLVATIAVSLLLVYLNNMRVEVPVTHPRIGSLKSKVPLQFLYVSNIPVLFVGIIYADILVFASFLRGASGLLAGAASWLASYDAQGRLVGGLAYYLSPPTGVYSVYAEPTRSVVYFLSLVGLSVVFGYLWVEVAGLNAAAQADQFARSGLVVPGMRSNPKVLEKLLDRYITPLTGLSSLIIGVIAGFADLLGVYGGGMGLLLAIGIVQQYYMLIAYERALEAYPALKRFLGE
ncbi:MAG: preprotein translocase subunit SecY [Desulfurococcaceae archaeon]